MAKRSGAINPYKRVPITTPVGDATTAVFAAEKYLQEERSESDAPAVEAPQETQAV